MPSLLSVLLIKFDHIIASSLVKDQVRRELVRTLPNEAMKAATVTEAMNVVAAASIFGISLHCRYYKISLAY